MPETETHSTPIYTEMLRRLETARARFYRVRVMYGTVVLMIAALGLLSGLSLIEALLVCSSTVRTLLLGAAVLGLVLLTARLVVIPLLQWTNVLNGISEREFALLVGEKFPDIKDRLKNILDIFDEQTGDTGRREGFHPQYSPELIDASFADLQKAAASARFSEVVSTERLRSAEKLFAITEVCSAILFVVPAFNLPFAAYRLIHFNTDFRPPAAFAFLVQPGDAEIVKGESLPLSISLLATGKGGSPIRRALPKSITLSVRQTNMAPEDQYEIAMDSSGQFHFTLAALRQSLQYHLEAEEIRSKDYVVNVTDRPLVRSLKIKITPPAYSRLPQQNLDDNIGDVTALPGTRIQWRVEVSKALEHASIVFGNGQELKLLPEGMIFAGEQTLRRTSTYHIALEDSEGVRNVDPIEYKLGLLTDEVPSVVIEEPGRNVDVTEAMNVPLRIKIHDDFGFTALKLSFRLIHSRYEQPQENFSTVPITLGASAKSSTDGDVEYLWNVSPLGLVPEDVVEYHAEVFDNDDVSGPKKGVSESFLLRLPSLDEVFADADKGQSEAVEKMDQSLEEAQDLKKNLDELSQDMKKNQQLDWQKQKKVEETLQRYQELTKKVEEASKSVEAMTQEMQKNNILSSETMEKYMELQRLLQQINSPEFQEAMKKMQQAMQNVSPDQLRQAMQQVQFSEEAFRQSIERTVQLLKRIQVEQKMDEMVKRAKDLEQQQENLEKETAASNQSEQQKMAELARKQEDITAQLAELQKQLAELRKKMEEFPSDMPMKQLEKAEEAARDSSMEQSMKESAHQLRSQKPQQATGSQQKASKGMQQMEQKFSEMQEQLLSNQMNEAMNGMKKAMTDLLELSQQEEELKNQSQLINPNSQQFRDIAEKQLGLQGDLAHLTNNLMELSDKSFVVTPELGHAIGKATANMAQAMTSLEQRNGQQASGQQKDAMTSLNQAASVAQSSMDAMQQGSQGGAGSLLQQLRRMAGEQQSINMQTEQLSQGKGLSQQQIQEMARLARQQGAVEKSLEELNKEAEGSSERNRIMGDLKRIANEMKEVVENLQQNNVNPNTIKQQQKILSRLLDAQTSMRERDYEQRRTSTAGTTPVRQSPAELQDESTQNQLRRDLLKAMEQGYSKDYQNLIRKYYESLDKAKQ